MLSTRYFDRLERGMYDKFIETILFCGGRPFELRMHLSDHHLIHYPISTPVTHQCRSERNVEAASNDVSRSCLTQQPYNCTPLVDIAEGGVEHYSVLPMERIDSLLIGDAFNLSIPCPIGGVSGKCLANTVSIDIDELSSLRERL
ncbi:MAG: hypothetical protein JWO84_592 [Parcubacteria group bacterium]|nr:hypothetical protein [Parcubacteria group bacterium]